MVMEESVAETVREKESKQIEMGFGEESKLSNQKKKRFSLIPRFGCMRSDGEVPVTEKPNVDRGFDVEASCNGKDQAPTHLIVMVNGIIGRFCFY